MSSVLPELFWSERQSLNSTCGGRMGCDSLSELGPPPDLILTIPPPPVPPFMEKFVSRLTSEGVNLHPDDGFDFPEEEQQCNLCHWSDGNGVGFIELAQKGPLIDDTWFLVIISSCVGATLLGIILAIGFLKYREGKLKPLSDVVLAKKEKALGLERCEAVLYPAPQMPPSDGRASRALWAGLKPLEGNHYTVDHCQPMDQKPARLDLIPGSDNNYDYADYSCLAYTPIGPSYRGGRDPQTTLSPPLTGRPVPSSSFENVGFVPGDESGEVERRGGADLAALTRAAYLLGGTKAPQNSKAVPHLYEMVTPRVAVTHTRRHKSLDHGGIRQTPVISAPTSVPSVRLPPLNSRYNGRYTLKAFPNGSHTLTSKVESPSRKDHHRKYAHVSLDRSGAANTTLAPGSPTDNIYASPITSPVI